MIRVQHAWTGRTSGSLVKMLRSGILLQSSSGSFDSSSLLLGLSQDDKAFGGSSLR